MRPHFRQNSSLSFGSSLSYQDSGLSSKFQKYINKNNQINLENDTSLKFKQLLEQNKLKRIIQIFKQNRGKNTPIEYKGSFNFLQRWETQSKQVWDGQILFQLPDTIFGLIISVILFLQKAFVIWGLTVFRTYQIQQFNWIFIWGLILILFDLFVKGTFTIKHYLYLKNNHQRAYFFTKKNILTSISLYSQQIYCLLYYTLALSVPDFSHRTFLPLLIYDISVAYLQYGKAENLYKKIKLFGIRSTYKSLLNLFDLMSLLVLIFHICSVIIYGMTKLSEQNWIRKQEIQHQPWLIKYIYSWYFTCTTMLTVGFGDITPSNYIQKVIISFVQIFGVALNGYVINQVGHTLSKIRENKQNKQKDISNTQKLAKVYKLNSQLAKKMRNYIVHNTIVNQQMNIEEQNNLLHKFNDQLRTQINNQNHLRTIKQNIFFVFYFSKKAQIQFAKRLQKTLFSPNQSISQVLGKQKLYILTKGKIQIFTDKKFKDKFYCKKMVKIIQKSKEKQISDNIFGYSSILYGMPTNLRGITKDFTVCYTLDKQNIHQVIHQEQIDFEYFYQLKDKIWMQKYPQKWQAPNINSIRFHYQPSIYCLIKKEVLLCNKLKNQRKFYIRSPRLIKTKITTDVHQYEQSDNQSSSGSYSNDFQLFKKNKKKFPKQFQFQTLAKIQNQKMSTKSIVPRSYKRKYLNKKYEEKRNAQIIESWAQKKQMQQFTFEICKQYQCYFPKKNLQNVLDKLRNKMNIETQLTLIDPQLKKKLGVSKQKYDTYNKK